MISYFFDNELVVVCAECERKNFDCPFPCIANAPKQKEDLSCSMGKPNQHLKIEIRKMEYHIQRSKINAYAH